MTPASLPRCFEGVTRRAFAELPIPAGPAGPYVTRGLARCARGDALPPRRLDASAEALLAIQRVRKCPGAGLDPGRARAPFVLVLLEDVACRGVGDHHREPARRSFRRRAGATGTCRRGSPRAIP